MERCVNMIPRKSFHPWDFVLVCLYLAAGLLLAGYAGGLQSRESHNFRCHSKEEMASIWTFLEIECLKKYDQCYSPYLPLYQFVLVTFSAFTTICVVYGFYVKSRVDEMVTITNFNAEDPRPNVIIRTRRVSTCHLLHLFLRFVLTVLSAVLQHKVLYPHEFPTEFYCVSPLRSKLEIVDANIAYLRRNRTSVFCTNLAATEETGLVKCISFLNISFATVACVEGTYLLFKLWQGKPEYNFLHDSNFCRFYLLNKPSAPPGLREFEETRRAEIANDTGTIQPLLPSNFGENDEDRTLDDLYVPVNISTGRAKMKHKFHSTMVGDLNKVEEYQTFPDESIPIENLQDLFLPNKDTGDKDPRTILVVGRPGIGKSLLCTKIMHDWSKQRILHSISKTFKFVFLFQFRWFNSEEARNLSLSQLLRRQIPSFAPPDLLQYLLDNPKEILLIFDGLDELKTQQNCTAEEQKAGNGNTDVMPISSLFVKLVRGKLLHGATVFTTTRITGVNSFPGLVFDRKAEIVGFTPAKVQKYVRKFCKHAADISDKIWNYIKGSSQLLSLCYIPANCSIFCYILEMCIKVDDPCSRGVSMPTSLTELYQRALRILIIKHNPEYHDKIIKRNWLNSDQHLSDAAKDSLNRLEQLAFNGMEENRLLFNSDEVEGIENCGLLHKLPSVDRNQFFFLHFTMQEFLAARAIISSGFEGSFVFSKAREENWCLIIQFVAGLLRDHSNERGRCFIDQLCQRLSPEKMLVESTPLLAIKCLYELGDVEIVEYLASKLQDNFMYKANFRLETHLAPNDYTAIIYFLKQLRPLRELHHDGIVRKCNPTELRKLLKERAPKMLTLRCLCTDKDLQALFQPELGNRCNFTRPGNTEINITEGKGELYKQVTHTNEPWNLTEIVFYKIKAKGITYLCDYILTSECFKLKVLTIFGNNLIRENVESLGNALRHVHCKLSQLKLHRCRILNEGCLILSNSLRHENCKLTELVIYDAKISDGVLSPGNALVHENCKLTKLDISGNRISHEGCLFLCDALTHENCKLTDLNISHNYVNDEGIRHLANALTHENCKLTNMKVSNNHITDEGVLSLAIALTHENCKLTMLDIGCHKITHKAVLSLCLVLLHENCKVNLLKIGYDEKTTEDVTRLCQELPCEVSLSESDFSYEITMHCVKKSVKVYIS